MNGTGFVLGLNGWHARSHDAAACIVKDGQIVAMAEEERFIRRKHAYDRPPVHAILWCLEKAGITLDEVEKIAVGWDIPKVYRLAGLSEPSQEKLAEVFFPRKFFRVSKLPNIELVQHHLAHAVSAFYMSGMDEASVLVVDGQGEDESVTFAVGKDTQVNLLWTLPIKCSLGYFYEAISDFIGLGADGAGKTMGLAPYGHPKYEFPQFVLNSGGYDLSLSIDKKDGDLDQQQQILAVWRRELSKDFSVANNVTFKFRALRGDIQRDVTLETLQKDIAASAQSKLEELLSHLTTVLVRQTKVPRLCLAGGVALNCSANTKIAYSGLVEDLFVSPVSNDAGVALGAALWVGGVRRYTRMNNALLGPAFTHDEIEAVLKKVGSKYHRTNNIAAESAKILSQGRIVSWFNGAMEIGPRALGARSILAHPGMQIMNTKVNSAKEREQWRPLAPSIMCESLEEYLDKEFESPFMLHTFSVRSDKRAKIPAVVHVDGTTRPQSVRRESNPLFYELIREFYRQTGLHLVLNTSFNGASEPIVCTPYDALVSFYSNSTDVLAIGNCLVFK